MSSENNDNSFDTVLLQLHPPYLGTNSHLSQSLEDFLLCTDSINDEDEGKTLLAREELKLEEEIIRIILSGDTEKLKPNSGQGVSIGGHNICVGSYLEKETEYRVWEWHGHILLHDEDNGYSPEYVYGNYFEAMVMKPIVTQEKKIPVNLGLRELIDGGGLIGIGSR